jgi:hypothetical protein
MFFFFFYLFSSTKLENRKVEQVLLGVGGGLALMGGGEAVGKGVGG